LSSPKASLIDYSVPPPAMDKYKKCVEDFFDRDRMMEAAQEVAQNPKPIVYGILIAAVVGWLVVSAFQRFKQPAIIRANTPDLEKPAARAPSKLKAPERPPGGTEAASR